MDNAIPSELEAKAIDTVREVAATPTGQQFCIHELFEAQARRTPEAPAVVCGEEILSYRDLDERANQLAHHLRRSGVGPDVLVGLCVERSLEMVVGILGILKAGGAYVPFDLSYPKERLAFMLQDTAVPVLLTQETRLEGVPTESLPKIICLDAGWNDIARESKGNLDSGAQAENLAYVIYTSGSTGKPKGVLVNHHNVVRLFTATDHWYHFSSADVWTLFHSYAFDFSVWEIWGALLYGGRVVVVPYLVSRSPNAFYELLCREKVTVLNQTPSAFRQLIWAEQNAEKKLRLHLRYVIFGGEALELQSLKPWFELHGDKSPLLVNMYGITETTVHVTYRPITLQDCNSGQGSVIGTPIPDLQIHLLGPDMKPIAVGEIAEMYVGGEGLARGYLNRAELTAERFIPDPFRSGANARLYKTGDVARRLPNGDFEYLGRCDDQVKIRGFRIELGEIESCLRKHPGVRDCVVLAREDQPGQKHLVAYLIPASETAPFVRDLRLFLGQELPDFMVPSTFQALPRFPLSPNGKVDRKALLELTEPAHCAVATIPANDLGMEIYRIWLDVLHCREVGLDDNFFDLGGDSIHLGQIHTRLQKLVGREVPITDLFEHTTIRALAAHFGATEKQVGAANTIQDRARRQRMALAARRSDR